MFDVRQDVRVVRNRAPGDQYSDALDEQLKGQLVTAGPQSGDPLDSEEARAELRQLLEWYYLERDKQASNRLEMALDADFYDSIQWDPEDAQALRDRGQMPLVFNEVAPMADWIIGTERRSRVDWKVLPRTEDDVQMADVKTKVMKYVSNVNRVVYERSRAFADAVKAGIGWVDDGARDDPTKDILYSKYEDWRRVLHDSSSYDLDLEDGRYLFRWRDVDEDIACMMFPKRERQVRMATQDRAFQPDASPEEDTWLAANDPQMRTRTGTLYAQGAGIAVDAKRRRVRLIECQYRKPMRVTMVADGPFKGAILNPQSDPMLSAHVAMTRAPLIDRVMMRTHIAVFTEAHLLGMGVSPYRHNRFSLTPIWCYRRGRDRAPYGIVRRVRDIQQDLNKRASKALFMLNTNQIFVDEGAVEDLNELRDEADRPDGMIVKKAGKEVVIRRDTNGATGQIQMMQLDAQSIQKAAGPGQENLGRQTNASSGEAIKARQLQGSVVTTEPFDNLRLATQIQGEKQLSLSEQFYSEPKVIRLTGEKGALQWVRINQPEQQPDGSVRFLDDITASQADFIVDEQDYAGTLRQVMFDSLQQLAQRLPPDISLRLLTMAFEFSDLPNKNEIADQIRKLTGERDPNKEPTPEEQQQAEQQAQAQAEALQIQRETAMATLAEQQAKVRELNARAAKMEAEAQAAGASAGAPGIPPELMEQVRGIQQQAADQIDQLSEQLRKAQAELANRTIQINREADTKLALADIDRDTKLRVAEIARVSGDQIDALMKRMDQMRDQLVERIEKRDTAGASSATK